MKKFVRSFSSRQIDTGNADTFSRDELHSSPLQPSQPTSNISSARRPSGAAPGFIPAGVTLYFPACPHSTPPTPRPAVIPPVLLTHVSSTGSQSPRLKVSQFFTTPHRCLDCSLTLATDSQQMIHDAFDGKIRAGRLRVGTALAEFATLQATPGSGSGSDSTTTSASTDIITLAEEITQAKKIVGDWIRDRDAQVKEAWDSVRQEWEGGVREVVRSDGSGEAFERCSFRFRHVAVPDVDDAGGSGNAEQLVEGGYKVEVIWEQVS